ncbi:MAG: S-layer homology domain-containing protein [Acidimicrobiia bacterium]|nr:S-layer homology domain-containing protein [Acidimicrobiia bacterium]
MDHPTPATIGPADQAAAAGQVRTRSTHRRSPIRRRVVAAAVMVLALLGGLVATGAPAGATVFSDVPEDHPFATPIDWAVTTGVTNGFDDGTFRPTVPVSRQAFAAFLARYDDGASASAPADCEGDGPFTDVPASHPFCAEITWLVDLGITTGFPDDTFRPTDPISRQAKAAFLTRNAAEDAPASCTGNGPFDDVPASHPFCAEITWMVDQGITTGFPDNTFRPTNPITRQAAAAFLWRLAGEPTDPVDPVDPVDPDTILVSQSTTGEQAAAPIFGLALSADGSTVAFTTTAHMVEGPIPTAPQTYVRDLETGVTTRVSQTSDGTAANGGSQTPALSADGRFVAFASFASNLVAGDTNGQTDVFVHDRQTDTTERVSVASDGTEGDGLSFNPAISADGRIVAFESYATTLVPDDTNDVVDVFVHDRQTGVTERVSVDSEGDEVDEPSTNPAISGDGRFVAFDAESDELIAESTIRDFVALHDRQAGTTTLGSTGVGGVVPNFNSATGSLSFDGRYLAFRSAGNNLGVNGWAGTDVYVLDRQTGDLELISVGADGGAPNGLSINPRITADGRFVAFTSLASNLVDDDTNGFNDVFVRDRQTGVTERASVAHDGGEGNDIVEGVPAISNSGLVVAFRSRATNLLPEETAAETIQAFVRYRAPIPAP